MTKSLHAIGHIEIYPHMITSITLANFKCFRQVSINPKRLTVLIGPNGAGKSAILQALLILKQSPNFTDTLELNGPLLQLPVNDFRHHKPDHPEDRVTIGLSGWLPLIHALLPNSRTTFNLRVECLPDGQLAAPKIGNTTFTFNHNIRPTTVFTPQDATERYNPQNLGPLDILEGRGPDIFRRETPPSQLRGGTAEFWDEAAETPSRLLRQLRFAPATRSLTSPAYTLGDAKHRDIPSSGSAQDQENATATTLAYSPDEVSLVSRFMHRVTGVGFNTQLTPPQAVVPVTNTPSGQVSLIADGSGTNSLVRLLFELVRAEPGATVLIEEPELSLHPRAQAELASLLAEEAKTHDKQVIMTTHSEMIAGRLLTEVAERKLTPDELAIYAFHKDDDGVAAAEEIVITELGQTMGGLTGFFDTNLEEMQRHARALMPHP